MSCSRHFLPSFSPTLLTDGRCWALLRFINNLFFFSIVQDGCRGEARSECSADDDCDGQLACIQGGCVNPCQALPCGANAYCEPEEHAAWCRCLPGFKEDSRTGACISLCQDILCGDNAQCVVSSATSLGGTSTTCACLEGYNGNPFPGGACVPDVCSASLPCQDPQVCVSGRCKERCEGVTCGVGAKCDKATNQCVCLPFFIGKPDLLCVPPVVPPVCQPPCGRNSHCEYGQPNRCVCHPGTSGNPYDSCGAQERTCDATKCGTNAECRQGVNRVDCVCPVGYQGNPYVSCEGKKIQSFKSFRQFNWENFHQMSTNASGTLAEPTPFV